MQTRLWVYTLTFTLLFVYTFLNTSCSWNHKKKNSYLIVAVDSLPFESVPCETSQIEKYKGLDELCSSSVRFTHAYTPSVLSQPALTSLLTGLYPIQHQVRDNGSNFLSAEVNTTAELAIKKGYRTSFFSGGAPIWSKTGLNQGFEYFDDFINHHEWQVFRPVKETIDNLITWLNRLGANESFFTVIYLPDLQFPQETTEDEFGEIRSQSYKSQLAEMDENLFQLFQKLKQKNLWDSTHVFLVGLNGVTEKSLHKDLEPVNLYSENSQVAMIVKPSTKKRDLGLQWKVDKGVSLVDLGYTINEMLGGEELPKLEQLPIVSLYRSFYKVDASYMGDRPLLIESSWANWHGVGNKRFAIKLGQYLFLLDDTYKVYNSLTDTKENMPIDVNEPFIRPYLNKVEDIQQSLKLSRWLPLPEDFVGKLKVGHDLWRGKRAGTDVYIRLKHLSNTRFWDQQTANWLAKLFVKNGQWEQLEEIANAFDHKEWLYVSQSNLGKAPSRKGIKGCAAFFFSYKKQRLKYCDSDLFKAFLLWKNDESNSINREVNFFKQYSFSKYDNQIAESNYANYLIWSVDTKKPSGPTYLSLFLNIPEHKKYKRELEAKIKRF